MLPQSVNSANAADNQSILSLLAGLMPSNIFDGLKGKYQRLPEATFTNATSITINDPGGLAPFAATPYPSNIMVSGLSGTITNLTVTLNNVSSNNSGGIDALLVGPAGQKFILVSDIGGNSGVTTNATVTFTDAAPSHITGTSGWGTNGSFSYKPTDPTATETTGSFPSPAPDGPYIFPGPGGMATFASTFNGTNPNGTWSLFIVDDNANMVGGTISGGWTLDITVAASAAATTTMVSSNNNPSFTTAPNNSVTLTANVTSTSTVNEGTVTFTDNGVNISGCVGVAVSGGSAQCMTNFSTEGEHPITATYNGTANFATSNGSLTQIANNHTTVMGNMFCNTGNLVINDLNVNSGRAVPYPSNIFVSGLSGTITNLQVKLNNVTHPGADDLDLLLVGPGGQKFILVSDAGGNLNAISNVSITFDDASGTTLADAIGGWGAMNSTVTSRPVNYGGADVLPAPAPAGPYLDPTATPGSGATLASAFNGANPNGTWSLYVFDDATGGTNGAIAGGWCLTITSASIAATTTMVSSNNNPSFTTAPNNTVTLTASVTSTSTVNEGTVSFTDNFVAIAGCTNVAVSGGSAQCMTSFSTEGEHPITATYNGTANFATSNGNLTQIANNHTVRNGNDFCNTGNLVINDGTVNMGRGTPYPSNIFVSGLGGTITNLKVTLNNVTHPNSDDLDLLLVGPGGQKFVLVSDAGGNLNAISNVNITFDDASGTTLADATGGWGAGTVTSRPVNYGGVDTFPAPAPAGPYLDPTATPGSGATLASAFNGMNPNGTWSLYVLDDAPTAGAGGSIAGGWCLTITTPRGVPVDFDGDGKSDPAVIVASMPLFADEEVVVVGGDILARERQRIWSDSYQRLLHFRSGRGFVELPKDVQAAQWKWNNSSTKNPFENLQTEAGLMWQIRQSSNGMTLTYMLGNTNDIIVPCDYDGDGRADAAVWTPSTGMFTVLFSSDMSTHTYALGTSTSDPTVVGDYDGDGKCDPAVYDKSTGMWSYLGGTNHTVLTQVTFGANGIPAPGDYDGDGKFDFGIQVPPTSDSSIAKFRIAYNDGTVQFPDLGIAYGLAIFSIVPGDYDGDGKTDIAQANLMGTDITWRVLQSSTGYMVQVKTDFGLVATDRTVQGDYDGDGKTDLAVFRSAMSPQDGVFIIRQSSTSTTVTIDFGGLNDYPVAFFNTH